MTKLETIPPDKRRIQIAPSILTADFGNLAEQVAEVEAAGADRLHLDVMDGHFVPNITFGPVLVAAVRRSTKLPVETHLMVECPESAVSAFRDAGADRIIVHVEATDHLQRLVEQIRHLGAQAGVALNPATPIIILEEIIPYVDSVLVMSVNPGFGGQSFIPTTPRKIYRVRRMLDRWSPTVSLGVDGGADADTIPAIVRAGADCIIAGSAVYNPTGTVAANITKLRTAISAA